MVVSRHKRLMYRRAVFLKKKSSQTLEQLLRLAMAKRKAVPDRTFSLGSGDLVEGTAVRSPRVGGMELQVTTYTPNEMASVVRHFAGSVPEGAVIAAPPPKEADYMDREVLAVVQGNDVALCCTNTREGPLEDFIWNFIEAAKILPAVPDISLEPVADTGVVQMIKREGIKEVKLKASLFKATMQHVDRKTVKHKIARGVIDELFALIGRDASSTDFPVDADLSATLVLRFNRWRSGELASAELDALADRLVKEEEGGYVLVTGANNRISGDKITLQREIDLPAHAKSVVREEAWKALRAFLTDLKSQGLIQQ